MTEQEHTCGEDSDTRPQILTEADALDVFTWVTPWALASSIDSSNPELILCVFCEIDDTVSGVLDHGMGSSAPAQVTHNPLLHNISLNVCSTIMAWLGPLDGDGIFRRLQSTWSSRGTRRIWKGRIHVNLILEK